MTRLLLTCEVGSTAHVLPLFGVQYIHDTGVGYEYEYVERECVAEHETFAYTRNMK